MKPINDPSDGPSASSPSSTKAPLPPTPGGVPKTQWYKSKAAAIALAVAIIVLGVLIAHGHAH